MAAFEKFRENWVRPALFFGNNPISLVGGALTSGSAVIMLGYWVTELLGKPSSNPYLGIIFFLILPFIFIAGSGADSGRRLCALSSAAEAGHDSEGLSQG